MEVVKSITIVIVQPNEAFQVIWIGWVASWVVASLWSGRTERRAATHETWIYRIVIFAGAILIAPWTAQVLGERPAWQVGCCGAYAFVGVILTGLALTWWARIHLGGLWSSAITRKEKHRLVETGPYAKLSAHAPRCAIGERTGLRRAAAFTTAM